ncbi:PAK4-inhibitor INKA2 isoform X2 [Silurus asotus]|uniref:PAK4-inhibitor INKA2 n=1 Tax=Silurus asotus TaxID=30991 RepID=A0AAD5FB75_SILAS|nr:PAK4-inhibitor INKA2 isoform X2 [Silurus asotus]
MERVPERKEMDKCLKRLKQEMTSMREAGDGLQTQMNSMMGALQELKILKVQTALEQLQISCNTNQLYQHSPHRPMTSDTALTHHLDHIPRESRQNDTWISEHPKKHIFTRDSSLSDLQMEPPTFFTSTSFEKHSRVPPNIPKRQEPRGTQLKGSLCNSASFSSSEDDSFSSFDDRDSNSLCNTASHSTSRSPSEGHQLSSNSPTMAELQGLMDTLSREGPSIDSDFSQFDTEDSGDWTSSLMSQSRNRQPLVLGDNVFADLVGNWLDLPELESRISGEAENTGRIAEASQHPLRLSCSQEFCRRLSLTTSIFKKVLRSIRPDREKLHKERPGWLHLEDEEETIFKRAKKKNKGCKPKDSVYRPFWTRAGGLRGKSKPKPENTEIKISKKPIFDYSSAVWV